MAEIKFGTDGWRAIIDEQFTGDNVARVAEGTALWLKQNFENPSAVVGHDCRRKGETFAAIVAKVLLQHGIKVHLAKGFVSTPMISLGAVELKASLGIIITASHNPPEYSGFKLKGHYGGPLLPEHVKEVEALIPASNAHDLGALSLKSDLLSVVDLETIYCESAKANFDLQAIRESGLVLGYDAMYGAGQRALPRLLPDARLYHCEHDASFQGIAPEPILKNLGEFAAAIRQDNTISLGLATDGDADRLSLFDGDGNFVDAHHIILLLIHYLCHYKKQKGKVATAFSTTSRVQPLCEHYGLPLDVVPIGFKHICALMLKEEVLLGGEESGGIAIRGHIPERDGIWIGLVLLEFMAKTGKTLPELIKEVYAVTGPFAYERIDLHVSEQAKQRIIAACKAGEYKQFGNHAVQRLEDMDGWKFFTGENEWVMIRASGTEPVLRTYAEASTREKAQVLLKATHETIL